MLTLICTKQPIKAGTELTFDYNTDQQVEREEDIAVPCKCGAADCRGFVISFIHPRRAPKQVRRGGAWLARCLAATAVLRPACAAELRPGVWDGLQRHVASVACGASWAFVLHGCCGHQLLSINPPPCVQAGSEQPGSRQAAGRRQDGRRAGAQQQAGPQQRWQNQRRQQQQDEQQQQRQKKQRRAARDDTEEDEDEDEQEEQEQQEEQGAAPVNRKTASSGACGKSRRLWKHTAAHS